MPRAKACEMKEGLGSSLHRPTALGDGGSQHGHWGAEPHGPSEVACTCHKPACPVSPLHSVTAHEPPGETGPRLECRGGLQGGRRVPSQPPALRGLSGCLMEAPLDKPVSPAKAGGFAVSRTSYSS